MNVCMYCISDRYVVDIIARGDVDNCSFCDRVQIPCVEATRLADLFSDLLETYIIDNENGIQLNELLQTDWELFGVVELEKQALLLNAVFGQNMGRYRPAEYEGLTTSNWDFFREQIIHENRFLHESELVPTLRKILPQLESMSSTLDLSQVYRARRMKGDKVFTCGEMGMPPIERTRNGRANPIGIPYLYTASSASTALAETRPSLSETICIGTFQILNDLSLIDLRDPKGTVSPFELLNEDVDLVEWRHNLELLTTLGNELSKPIPAYFTDLEYIPTQFICELIKKMTYDGVIYTSGLDTGFNVALFRESSVECVEIRVHKVVALTYESNLL